jgi:hypothetical protein
MGVLVETVSGSAADQDIDSGRGGHEIILIRRRSVLVQRTRQCS